MFNPDTARQFLFKLDDAIQRSGRQFFLMQGTALGAWRDGGFTPTEGDIDLGILFDPKLIYSSSILGELTKCGIEVNTWNRHRSRSGCPHTIVCQWRGHHADIVGWFINGDKRYAQAPSNVNPHYCIVHDAELVESWKAVQLFGREFNVPNDIEKYLELEYGPDWRTPREDHASRTRVYGYLDTLHESMR